MKLVRVAVIAALALVLAAPASGRQEDEFRWSGSLAAGKTLQLKNANGAIYAGLAGGNEVEVVAIKEGPRGDRREVEIEVVEHADGVTICSVYPGGWLRRNTCEPGDQGRISSHDNETEVTFRLRVPAGVKLDATTMNGRVEIDGLRSDVEALTMNGAVKVSTTGWASAQTMNGSVEVEMGEAGWTGDIEVSTMNGGITVRLPPDADVEVSAKTMNGSIESDWALEHSGWIRNRADGTIGAGGRRLELSTMNGSIRIRRS